MMSPSRGEELSEAPFVSFGAGITVNSYSTISDPEIIVNISIASDAELGNRDVTVTDSPGGESTYNDGFTVEAAPTPSPAGGGLSGGAIAGIVIGSCAGAGLIYYLVRRRRRRVS